VVVDGVTVPLDVLDVKLLVPVPVHAYEVAAGLHDAISVEVAPALIMDGEAASVHVGVNVGGGGDVLQTAVRLPTESAVKEE